jgi:hypothetical protein
VAAVVVVVAAGLAALGLYLAPRVLPNIGAEVAVGDTVETLRGDGVSARITVPDGWVARRAWQRDDEISVRSPDGGVEVTLRAVAEDAAAAAAGVRGAVPDSAALVTERLASGLSAVHAEADGDGVVVAAVGAASGASVSVVARADPERLTAYRPVIARVLEGIEVGG